jgi:hypothetical protein
MNPNKPRFTIMFLCAGNSARSIFGEYLLKKIAPTRFELAHWNSPDPAAVEGSEADKLRAFWQVAQQIKRRLELLASLPFEKLDVLRLEAATKEIGIREKIQLGDQTPAYFRIWKWS